MPNRTRTDDMDLVHAAKPAAAYDRDFYSWSLEQARLMRDGRWDALDRENVAEEIESLARGQFDKLVCVLRGLLLHILTWDHQPPRRTRSLVLSVKEQRIEFEQVLSDNPGLHPRIDEAVARAYPRARLRAIKETDLEPKRFPDTCPYSWNDIVSREFSI